MSALFKPLRPFKVYVETDTPIQCSHRMSRNPANPEHYFRYLKRKMDARGFDMRLCGRAASVELNGAPLCTQHAGELTLSMLMCGELVLKDGSSPLPPEPPIEYADIGEVRITRRRDALAAAASGGDVKQAPGEAPQSGPNEDSGNAQRRS